MSLEQLPSNTSTNALISRLRDVDEKDRLLVFGYIREYEQKLLSLHHNNIFYSIPELITIIVLSFYHIADIFQDLSDDLVKSGQDNNTITKREVTWSG